MVKKAPMEARRFVALMAELIRRLSFLSEEDILSDPRCISLAECLQELLCKSTVSSPGIIERRGRPRTHDSEWARDTLIAMAIESPDGLPSKQVTFVSRLRDAFENAGRTIPGDTWLNRVVGEFYRSANIFEIEAADRYRKSPDLQATFPTEAAFIAWRKTTTLLERQWYESAELQTSHPSPQHYINHRASQRISEDSRMQAPARCVTNDSDDGISPARC